jgi:hypothetical protein
MAIRTGRPRGWALAALLALAGCGGDDDSSGSSSGGGSGLPSPPLWNDTSTSSSGGSGDTPLLWNDPNTAETQLGILDPSDIRTYTYPDIYILGNKHPLMTDVTSRDYPVIITQENRLTELLIEWRVVEYERAIGMRRGDPGFPRQAFLSEYLDLRRNGRAHAKHYALWHTDVPLPIFNAEGDATLLPGSIGTTHAEVFPNNTEAAHTSPRGRLWKCFIDVEGATGPGHAGQLVASGTDLGIPDRVFTKWVTDHPAFLLKTLWTHLGVGYWTGTNSVYLHYWNAVFAERPRARVVTPVIPIIFF